MKNLYTTFFSLVVFMISASAQSDIVPLGGDVSNPTGSVSYTVGQTAILNVNDGDYAVMEGVQVPFEIQTVGIDEHPGIVLNAVVFPNPTRHSVVLRISDYDMPENGLLAQLYDANGRLLQNLVVNGPDTPLDMEQYATAAYYLRVLDGNALLKTFKIIKTR